MASIFLSHSSVDKEFVRELNKILEDNGVKCWIDEAEIMIGDSLIKKIDEGIKVADYVAVILSPNSIKSPWVEKELEIAITKEVESGNTKVLPLLIENCEIPGYLKGKKFGDFRTSSKSISGLRELLRIVKKEGDKQDNRKNSLTMTHSGKKKDSEREYKRFLEIYNKLTEEDYLSNTRFSKSKAKMIAELFCKEENHTKFNEFIKTFDELTEEDYLGNPKFNKSDAFDIALKRVSISWF